MLTLNIIPPELKKQIHLGHINKRINSYFLISLFTIISYGVVLFLVTVILQKDYKYTSESASFVTRDAENYNAKTKEINMQISQIEEIQKNTVNWSIPIHKLINTTKRGIQINNLSLDKKNNSLQISGMADTREDLLSFKDNLNDTTFLSGINLPIESLLKKENITFNITATISSYEFNQLQ